MISMISQHKSQITSEIVRYQCRWVYNGFGGNWEREKDTIRHEINVGICMWNV